VNDRAALSPLTRIFQAPATALPQSRPQSPTAEGDELCGYGPIPVVDGIPHWPPDIVAATESALSSLAAELAARSADSERAMGMYLQLIAAWNAARSAWSRTHGDCADDDKSCQSDAARSVAAATADARHALVRLATTTSDADAYALAIYACGYWPDESPNDPCALLNYGQWARIEPENAVPWLYLAADAQRRHDRSAFEAALNRASKARYNDPHQDLMDRILRSDTFAAQAPPVQVALAAEMLGIQGAFASPEYLVLTQTCSVAAQADPNRVQTCGDLAATLVEHGRSEVDVFFGGKVAERMAPADPRLSHVLDEADAIRWEWSQEMRSMLQQEDRVLSCDSLRVLRRIAAARARLGESGRLRQELAASGITTAQAAERWRAEKRRPEQPIEDPRPPQ
jgi:hypothetical protein